MNVAVIGSGGREHAICESLIKSNKIKKLFCLPGNGGTALIAQNTNINLSNFKEIRNFVKKK
jgi:phosphoribosylamine--glycine ligase